MYAFGARLNAGQELDIPRRADFSLDLPALQAVCAQQRPKVLFLANPNNPDGQLLTAEEIESNRAAAAFYCREAEEYAE